MTDSLVPVPDETVNLSYSAGSSVALVAPGCALVFAEAPSGATVARCWPLVRDGAGVAAIIEALVSEPLASASSAPGLPSSASPTSAWSVPSGLRSMSGFALACADAGGASVVLRAPGQALVSSADGTAHWLTADGLATWAEFRLGIATTAVTIGVDGDLAAQSAAPVAYPLVGGTVLAGSLTLYLDPADAGPAFETAAQAAPEPPAPEPPAPEPLAPEPAVANPAEPTTPNPASLPASPASVSVTVQAVACPYGHLGPPYEPYCRICGTAIEDPRPFLAERPPLGLLRLSTGDVVPLDRGVILGRNPRVTAEHDAGRPHLVRLPSPDNDVSRTHVEVRLADWQVLVIDLGSTNGTTVTIPGRAPVRLRAHEPMPLEPNAEVNLADEIVFRYEVPVG